MLLSLFVLSGCAERTKDMQLVVRLLTDFVPQHEFVAVEVVVDDERVAMQPVFSHQKVSSEGRTFTFDSLEPNASRRIRASLLDADGNAVVERIVRFNHSDDRLIRVLLSRDCRGISCPSDGGDATAKA